MYFSEIFKLIGKFLIAFSLLFLIPISMSIYYEFFVSAEMHPQPHTTFAFLYSLILTLGSGISFLLLGSEKGFSLHRKEALVAVVLVWFILPFVASFPFLFN